MTPTDIPRELAGTVAALANIASQSQRRVEHAQRVHACILGLSTVVLRSRGFSDGFIAERLGCQPKTFSQSILAAKGINRRSGGDSEVLRDIATGWSAAQQAASPWVQLETVESSHEVINRHHIDPGEWPLSTTALDLDALELVHQHSGESIIVYSLQRWKGTPRPQPSGPSVWDKTGRYIIEFVSTTGERGAVKPENVGLSRDDLEFTSVNRSDRRLCCDSDAVFVRVSEAVRREYGALPPLADAFSLLYAGWSTAS